jgi:hypothetical protein
MLSAIWSLFLWIPLLAIAAHLVEEFIWFCAVVPRVPSGINSCRQRAVSDSGQRRFRGAGARPATTWSVASSLRLLARGCCDRRCQWALSCARDASHAQLFAGSGHRHSALHSACHHRRSVSAARWVGLDRYGPPSYCDRCCLLMVVHCAAPPPHQRGTRNRITASTVFRCASPLLEKRGEAIYFMIQSTLPFQPSDPGRLDVR